MLKKLWLIALSSLLVLPAFTSADTNSFEFSKVGSSYSPSSFTTNGWVLWNISLWSCQWYNKCAFSIKDTSNTDLCYLLYATSSSSIQINTCSDLELSDWSYTISTRSSQWLFDMISFDVVWQTIPVDPETPENSDVLWFFWSTLEWLVGNLLSSFGGILPTLILVWFGVLVVFVFWWYIKHASVELFHMWKDRNKSMKYYSNEDVVQMYSNWRKKWVSKHDINNIIKDKKL